MGLVALFRPFSRGWRLRSAVAVCVGFAGSAGACQVEKRATVPLARAGTLFLVPVTINGTVADFILDTGAERTVIGVAAADRLKIARDEWVSTDVQGTGGRDRQRLGRPSTISLAGLALRRHTVAADNSVVVGPIMDSIAGHPVAGLLGQDFLSPFDIEFDRASGSLSLYTVTGCSARFVPWHVPYQAIAAWRPVRNVLALPVTIGRTTLQAELDSGASETTITLPGMIQLGLAAGGGEMMRGFGTGSVAARTEHFPSVRIGDLPPEPMDADIAPLHTLRSIGALLGADWLGARHVWVSWATDQVFVTSAP